MKLFDDRFIDSLSRQYKDINKRAVPFIAKLAIDPSLQAEKERLERWFCELTDQCKQEMIGRLREENSRHHFAAYFELVYYQWFKSLGYVVTFHPVLKEGSPDLMVDGGPLDKPMIVEIATVFDEPSWEKEEMKFRKIIDQLDEVEHYYSTIISNESEQIPDNIDYDKLKKQMVFQLDTLHTSIKEPSEFGYEDGKLRLRVTAIPNLRKGPIVVSWGSRARAIGYDQIRRAIEKKIGKYKSVKKLGYYFVVALNISNVPVGELGLINTLFGNDVVRITRGQNGAPRKTEERKDFSGLLTIKPGLGGIVRNTRLSAIINMETKWEGRNRRPHRVHYPKIIHNPAAAVPLSTDIFKELPQFITVSEAKESKTLSWINDDVAIGFVG